MREQERTWKSWEAIVATTKPQRASAAAAAAGSTLRSLRWIVVVTKRPGISLVEYGEATGLSIVPKRRAFKLVPRPVVMEIEPGRRQRRRLPRFARGRKGPR